MLKKYHCCKIGLVLHKKKMNTSPMVTWRPRSIYNHRESTRTYHEILKYARIKHKPTLVNVDRPLLLDPDLKCRNRWCATAYIRKDNPPTLSLSFSVHHLMGPDVLHSLRVINILFVSKESFFSSTNGAVFEYSGILGAPFYYSKY